jgi:hypothetical protein
VLGQPDKFRPPSHPARSPAPRHRKRLYYGPQTSSEQKAAFDSKQYPYSLPPKKTFMYWFLTTRSIHVWISLVRCPLPIPRKLTTGQGGLVILGSMIAYREFRRNNRYPELLPSGTQLLTSPLESLRSLYAVTRLNEAAHSREFRQTLDREVDDARRRREYRAAHGLPDVVGVAAWLGLGGAMAPVAQKVDDEAFGRRAREAREARTARAAARQERAAARKAGLRVEPEVEARAEAEVGDVPRAPQEKKRRVFLGIWGW